MSSQETSAQLIVNASAYHTRSWGITGFRRLGVALALMLAVGVTQAVAQPPATMSIRGQLLDSQGDPLTGARDYEVRFYDSDVGNSQLGTTLTGTATVSAEGLFNLSITPPAQVLSSAAAWYEIAVDSSAVPDGVDANDVFPKRTKVQSVPFALLAGEAGHVDAANIGNGNVSNTELDALIKAWPELPVALRAVIVARILAAR